MQVLLEANPDAPNVLLSASPSRERSKLINIDNGGTLTDICVIDGPVVYRTKTLTTPHDLSQCLFDGLKKASHAVYGSEDLTALLLSTSAIRYSTTQGTNALVERKGPRLGLIFGGALSVESLKSADGAGAVFASLVNDRVSKIDITLDTEALEHDLIRTVGGLASSGANRLVISVGGLERQTHSSGSGPVDATFKAIEAVVQSGAELQLFSVNNITSGTESQGEVTVRLSRGGRIVNGLGADTDIVVASAKAYLSALNKLDARTERVSPQV